MKNAFTFQSTFYNIIMPFIYRGQTDSASYVIQI